MREVVNAIQYLLATNCGWRALPAHFPNRSTVRHYYDAWRQSGVWGRIEGAVWTAGLTNNAPTSPDGPGNEETPKPAGSTS